MHFYHIYQIFPPGTGKLLENWLISFLKAIIYGFYNYNFNASLKSFNFVPLDFLLICTVNYVALSKNFIISTKSDYLHPLVVIAGLPILTPDGIRALLSPGTVFLLMANEI